MQNDRDIKESTINKVYVNWQDVEDFIKGLPKYLDLTNCTGVYGPARGGLIFAVMVSHKYNLPFLGAPQKGCLCIDDICDTGDTSLAWRNKGYTVATMFYKKGSKVIPDYWKYEKTNEWIVFPWEL